MADKKFTREDCIALLRDTHARLLSEGQVRYPCRSDFSEDEVVAVKAFLGPWPRALEAAGIKPPREDGREQKIKEKRIRARVARRMEKLSARDTGKEDASADK